MVFGGAVTRCQLLNDGGGNVLWMSWKKGHMGLVRCFPFLSNICF